MAEVSICSLAARCNTRLFRKHIRKHIRRRPWRFGLLADMHLGQMTDLQQRQVQSAQPKTWEWYFDAEQYTDDDRRALLIREMAAFFFKDMGWEMLAHGVRQDLCRQLLTLDIDFEVLRAR